MQRRTSPLHAETGIVELAQAFSWHHHHARCAALDAEGYADGFPSNVLCRDEDLIFVTVAGRAGITKAQKLWVERLVAVRRVEMLVVHDGLGGLARLLRAGSTVAGGVPRC